MEHLGDITKISGYTAPIVDCIIGGSPCQDLSVAGKRAGLDGERSGLFMEQIRIIKEMRHRDIYDNGRTNESARPRYMVWENVPGAFSSNKGEDFRVVLEETVKVADQDAIIPQPPKGKWTTSGCIVGDGWSIAWRVFDAQFWGVPQRRRRIALVADFGGQSAPEILFVRKSLSGNTEPSRETRKGASTDAKGGSGASDLAFTMQMREGKAGGGKGALIAEELSATLRSSFAQTLFQPCSWDGSQVSPTLTANNAGGSQRMPDKDNFNCVLQPVTYNGSNVTNPLNVQSQKQGEPCHSLTSDNRNLLVQPVTYDCRGNGDGMTCATMTGDHQNRVTDYTSLVVSMDRASFNQGVNAKYEIGVDESGVAHTVVAKGPGAVAYKDVITTSHGCFHMNPSLNIGNTLEASDYKDPPTVAYGFDSGASRDVGAIFSKEYSKTLSNGTCPGHHNGVIIACGVDAYNQTVTGDKSKTFNATASDSDHVPCVMTKYIVRRLTPLECERLQGYPDGWTDIGEYINTQGKKCKTSDAARYKALGNSIALPSWKWVLKKLCSCYERDATMASLFDGIGGFPLLWEQINGKGSALWASEIEEFPIAVTKVRIG